MALHGSVSANLSPILFKGNNRALGVNVLIHQDQSGSMSSIVAFYRDGSFIEELQNQLLNEKIGSDLESYPNLYSFFDTYSRNPSSAFTIINPRGSLTINQSFIRGQSTGSLTRNLWTNGYIVNTTNHIVNICTDVAGTTTGGRLRTALRSYPGAISEDVHGNLWSIFTTPNAISTGTPGRFGSVISSSVRQGSVTVIITNSNEQSNFWDFTDDMINNSVVVGGGAQRTINGPSGEIVFRNYKVISLSSYFSTDGYDGILFYGPTSTQPYGYVTFTGATTYTITRSANAPNGWVFADTDGNRAPTRNLQQAQNTLLLASETKGALFKINRIFNTGTDRRVAFSRCLAEFIADTV
jgi:hypothetical protein